MEGNFPLGSACEDGSASFAERLYSIYRRDLGGALCFEEFIQRQLAVDLLAEFVPDDRRWECAILADVLHLLTADDFETDEDL